MFKLPVSTQLISSSSCPAGQSHREPERRSPVWPLYMIVASLSDKLIDNPPGLGQTLADSSGQ